MRCSWYRIVDILGLVTLVYLPILVKASENASFLEVVVELVQPVDFSPVIPVFVLSNDTIPASNELQLLLLQSPATLYPSGTSQEQPRNDSVLDDCHFMSFEEWKKQKIIESNNTPPSSHSNQSINNTDIKLVNTTIHKNSTASSTNITLVEADGKVYKDKFNFASVDCAATIVKTNAKAKGASAILKENKDSYLLNECSVPNKYVIIELCQDILVDLVVIGNFEFFSSMFKDIRVSVSDRFPSQAWKELGQFTAENIRDVQSFKIQNPLIWARYLKLEILSHYGNEYYCPISIVRVHGKTMMDEFKEDEEKLKENLERKEVEGEEEVATPQTIENEDILLINQSTLNECRVIMPHLQLNEFLKDLNTTETELCVVVTSDSGDPQASTTQVSSATVATQESIYKNIMKRLALLESNATLSLLYIEEQLKLLSTAFANLEKRQSSNFNSLISSVNVTLINQLNSFKESYNNLHDQYNNLFKIQQNSHRQIMLGTNKKINQLVNDLTFQKRVSIFNTIIIICLLVYVILTRDVDIEIQEDHDIEEDEEVLVTDEKEMDYPEETPLKQETVSLSSPFNPQKKKLKKQRQKS
ncbi:MAG: SUN domain-containing protein [Asgard group archaeon]|nr:SUN domain-containing protein [Asgard group archaeon]